ncbi:toxin-antitoxin system, toxin component, RelE family [Aeromicrobium marinum DSM 15272]|uniref:Toxin-antitoxin system, toxin component, RelE family n=1 Tax=Aeromicrobium marinum DSM 15272 TaxID=585531 RepID=E2S8B8_9ACTN|nr:type II toxin-antitoxin system RelE/ParE family toxin [Aeromicrobium marinum]EFQ84423.1 toxin-antitoxin system, toxin component, RelE family [Aeromicrobium marinum DSM 15272]
MIRGFGFHPEARAEFFADVEWYDERELGVGARFEIAVREAIDAAVDSPDSWGVWPGWERSPAVRSKRVNGFPYRVVYFVTGEQLAVVAIAYAKRRPGYWRERINP